MGRVTAVGSSFESGSGAHTHAPPPWRTFRERSTDSGTGKSKIVAPVASSRPVTRTFVPSANWLTRWTTCLVLIASPLTTEPAFAASPAAKEDSR